ncbi:hypothetical protein QJS04_geneDACA001040 [Acorus gramineus]|uniref:CRM domain-containing protein n=1 Tax=Acorus gramineus TaxID=55184 RepID=A0AAV9AEA2_ACOGR|nr:hypothetical protein QJS04_geneDACA001040 [Acorus gramineus]
MATLPRHLFNPFSLRPLSSSHKLITVQALPHQFIIPPPPSLLSIRTFNQSLPPQHQTRLSSSSSPRIHPLDSNDVVDSESPVRDPHQQTIQLTVKEKKELASYAHSLGKKLKSQQVGKGGVTPSVAAAFVENLECNELLKYSYWGQITLHHTPSERRAFGRVLVTEVENRVRDTNEEEIKVHGSCPGELEGVIKELEESTGSVAVGQIGRTVILYRPSLSKMKKKSVQNMIRSSTPGPTETEEVGVQRVSSRRRYGSSRN